MVYSCVYEIENYGHYVSGRGVLIMGHFTKADDLGYENSENNLHASEG